MELKYTENVVIGLFVCMELQYIEMENSDIHMQKLSPSFAACKLYE